MSAKSEQLDGERESDDEVCASCGVAGVDNVKLKKCSCGLVKYCGIKCQKDHRPKHKKACRKKMAELHDKTLFEQPDCSHWGECPICFLPLPIDMSKSKVMGCCCKMICGGCFHTNMKRENEQGLEQRCAFCREPLSESEEEYDRQVMKRVKKYNDPVAMTERGKHHHEEGDFRKSLEYWTKAAESGNVEAHYCLGGTYYRGDGVEKDVKKAVCHLEQAAIRGHAQARGFLADYEAKSGRFERANKHYIIAANLGCDSSLKAIKVLFVQGIVSKEVYAAALRGHQAAVDSTKSAERDKAEEAERND